MLLFQYNQTAGLKRATESKRETDEKTQMRWRCCGNAEVCTSVERRQVLSERRADPEAGGRDD